MVDLTGRIALVTGGRIKVERSSFSAWLFTFTLRLGLRQLFVSCGVGLLLLPRHASPKMPYFGILRFLSPSHPFSLNLYVPLTPPSEQEADYKDWKDRLHFYGLDLRQLPALHKFLDHIKETYTHLDMIINISFR